MWPFGFLPDLRAFMVELWCGVAALALLIAAIALLGAKPSWLVEKIPVVGAFIASIRQSAGFVLLGLAILSGGFGAGYFMRGSLERERALAAKIETDRAIKAEQERRAKAVAAAREDERKRADELSAEIDAMREQQRRDDEASRANDAHPGLRRSGVQRLNKVGRP